MATYDFSKYMLYRWRYALGYIMVGLLLAGLLLFAGLFLPGGLSADEMNSVVQSQALSVHNPLTLAIPDLPYHAVQAAFLSLFGISVLTIKLPSLLFALFTAVGVLLLLSRWFRPGIAVLATLIAISNSQFLFIAQSGTPAIMCVFWPVLLLLLGTQVTRVKHWRFIWKLSFALAAALSLYTPLALYALVAIGLVTMLHPHLRTILRKLSKKRLVAVVMLFIIVSAPLVYLVVLQPSLGLRLLGVPASWPPNLLENLQTIVGQYLSFWKPNTSIMVAPVLGLGSAVLILFGLYRIILTRDTTRSYLVLIWLACLVPVLLFNPLHTTVTFIPAILLMTAGLQSLIAYWYRLFPINPYARVAGLVPIIILVGASILLGTYRYAYSYHYSPAVVSQFSSDVALLPTDTKWLVVGQDEKAFWQAFAAYRPGLSVVVAGDTSLVGSAASTAHNDTSDPAQAVPGQTLVLTRQAYLYYRDSFTASSRGPLTGYTIQRLITNSLSNDADRLYIYQKNAT